MQFARMLHGLNAACTAPAGKGAYGTVYQALDNNTGELVAIKVIPVTDQDRDEFMQIQKEIAFLSECNHPNVVRYQVRTAPGPGVRACRRACMITCPIWCMSIYEPKVHDSGAGGTVVAGAAGAHDRAAGPPIPLRTRAALSAARAGQRHPPHVRRCAPGDAAATCAFPRTHRPAGELPPRQRAVDCDGVLRGRQRERPHQRDRWGRRGRGKGPLRWTPAGGAQARVACRGLAACPCA